MGQAQVSRAGGAVLLAAAAFLFVNLFVLPATPIWLQGDQVYFWNFAQRMLGGEHVYRDFLQYTPPGIDLIYRAALELFGVRIWLPNAIDLLLGAALCAICFALARRVMDRAPALVATFLFLVWIYGKALNGTHHWFSIFAILCAVLAAPRSAAAAGALLGLASFFTQTHGVFAFAGYAAFLVWARRPWKSLALSGVSFVIVLGALVAPFVASVGLPKLWYLWVTYSDKYLAHGQHLSLLGLMPSWHNLPDLAERALVDITLPIVYAVTLFTSWRTEQRDVMLLAFVGAALYLEIALSPDWVRAYAVSMPGVILLIRLLPRSMLKWAWVVIACLGLQETVARQRGFRTIVDLPSGRAATTALEASKLQWLEQHIQPGQYFFQATWPQYYFPLDLRNPAYLSEITENESTRPEDIDRTVRDLETKQPQYILWSPYNRPDPQHPLEDHIGALRAYLLAHYQRVATFSDGDEMWERAAQSATSDGGLSVIRKLCCPISCTGPRSGVASIFTSARGVT
jgi:hypothetical protein